MSWNNIYKLIPQKPKSEFEQDLDTSTEFLVWDTQFNLNNPSDNRSAILLQDTLIDDTVLSQISDTLET